MKTEEMPVMPMRPAEPTPDVIFWATKAFCVVVSIVFLSACTVVSIKEDAAAKAAQSGNFDANTYVEALWSARIVPYIDKNTHPLGEVLSASAKNPLLAGKTFGRQAGEGSPWTYVVSDEGIISAINTESKAGQVTVTTSSGPVILQVGPVVSGSALRDALPFVNFNDFTNQIDFAYVSKAINARALKNSGGFAETSAIGTRIRFVGATSIADHSATIKITPLKVEVLS